ncbi:MAG TPA: hypothetical protein VKJ65_02015, partial [Phycisphaerae bacterium]|nr:hypothetical protein [Phycisphaerae bacterium]
MIKRLFHALAVLILLAAFDSAFAESQPTPLPLAQAYQKILSTLRQPPADGVVILSAELPPELVKSGLEPGDVIMRAAGKSVATPADLAAQFAAADSLSLSIARGQTNLTLQVPNSVNSMEMLNVTAGLAAPLNPPATPRKDFDLLWNQVPTLDPQPGQAAGHDMWFLVFDSDQDACGALHLTTSAGPDASLDWDFLAPAGGPLPAQAWHIEFQTGDNHSTLPFQLQGALWWLGKDWIIMGQNPNGSELFVKINGHKDIQNIQTLPGAVPTPALSMLAAALPHKSGIVLPVAEIMNGSTQPGCVLVTRGEDKISIGGAQQTAWKVDLLRYDIPAYSFWF